MSFDLSADSMDRGSGHGHQHAGSGHQDDGSGSGQDDDAGSGYGYDGSDISFRGSTWRPPIVETRRNQPKNRPKDTRPNNNNNYQSASGQVPASATQSRISYFWTSLFVVVSMVLHKLCWCHPKSKWIVTMSSIRTLKCFDVIGQ